MTSRFEDPTLVTACVGGSSSKPKLSRPGRLLLKREDYDFCYFCNDYAVKKMVFYDGEYHSVYGFCQAHLDGLKKELGV